MLHCKITALSLQQSFENISITLNQKKRLISCIFFCLLNVTPAYAETETFMGYFLKSSD